MFGLILRRYEFYLYKQTITIIMVSIFEDSGSNFFTLVRGREDIYVRLFIMKA